MVNTTPRRHKDLKEMSNAMCVSNSKDSTSTDKPKTFLKIN